MIRNSVGNNLRHARQLVIRIDDDVAKTVYLVVLHSGPRVLEVRQQGVQHLVIFLLPELFRDDDCFDIDLLEAVIQFGKLISWVHRHLKRRLD